MITFDKDSGLVNLWVDALKKPDSIYTLDNVPNISNLREIVILLLN